MNDFRAQYDTVMAKARTLATKAETEGRGFTEHEQAVALELQRQAGELEPRMRQAESDAAVKAAIAELGNDIGVGASDTKAVSTTRTEARPVHGKVKAAGGSGSWGQAVVKAHSNAFGGFKALLPSGAVPVTVPLAPEPVRMGEPVLALRQLITPVPNTGGPFAYMRQTVRDHNAAPVAPGARKPRSTYTLARQEGRTVTIAHLSEPVHRQDLDDAPMLEQFLDAELRLGLEETLEDQIINGSGIGENFTGISNVSGLQAQVWDTSMLISCRKAITKLERIGITPTGFLLGPDDWETLELLTLGDDATFALSTGTATVPVDRAARRLWGLPVVVSNAVAAGTGYLADFAGSVELHMREEARIDWNEGSYDPNLLGAGQGASLFETNQLEFRCELRAGLAVTRPAGVVEIDLAA